MEKKAVAAVGEEPQDEAAVAAAAVAAEEEEARKATIKRRHKEAVGLAMCSGLIKSEARLQGLFAQLRKASNHPFLFPGNEAITMDGSATEEIVKVSGKMVVLDKLLKALFTKGHRVVLFSQFTRTLDILSDYLDMRGYRHTRLDGSTTRVMREVRINLFNKENSKLFVFLLTTRAGGEGVNLFTADTAILFDSDWNPQVDIQAMARVHRIGQKKIVHVYRLVTAGSVEERIVQRAQKKLFLDMMVNRVSTAEAKRLDEEGKKRKREAEKEAASEAAAAATRNAEEDVERAAKAARGSDDGEGGAAMEVEGSVVDSVVGSTTVPDNVSVAAPSLVSDTQALENRIEQLRAEIEAEESEEAGAGVSKVFAALKFGWNSVFSATGQGQKEITDADIQYIIDRSRGGLKLADDGTNITSSSSSSSAAVVAEVGGGVAEEAAAAVEGTALVTVPDSDKVEVINGHELCKEDAQMTLEKFDEHEAWVTVDHLKFGHAEPTVTSTTAASAGEAGNGAVAGENANKPNDTLPAKASTNSFDNLIDVLGIKRSKRVSESRTVMMEVEELGLVEVLKSTIDDGQSMEVNHKSKAEAQALFAQGGTRQRAGPQRAGRDYEHQNHCQVCRDGGTLIVCERCPMSYHMQCLGLKKLPTELIWACPHHKCVDCGRTASAAGLIFRCEMCELAYCEDCLPSGTDILGDSDILTSLGFTMGSQFCYVHCSQKCINLAKTEALEYHQQTTAAAVESEAITTGGEVAPKARKVRQDAAPTSQEEDTQRKIARGKDIDSAIDNCYMADVEDRLNRDKLSSHARFTSLNEIPQFHLRLAQAKIHTVVLLLKVVCAIDGQISGDTSGLVPQGSEITAKILNFKGVPVSWSYEQKAQVFLSVVKILAQGGKEDLPRVAAILGLSPVVPFKRSTQLLPDGKVKYCYEPKFIMSRSYQRTQLEEALAAFLVVPTPQNMLLPKETASLTGNEAPIDCILYSLRLLESLGEYLTDANKQYFTSMSPLDDRSLGLNAWLPVYPTKIPADRALKRQWIEPVCRLYRHSKKTKDDTVGLKKSEIDWLTSPFLKLTSPSTQKKPSMYTVDLSDDEDGMGNGSDSDFEEGEGGDAIAVDDSDSSGVEDGGNDPATAAAVAGTAAALAGAPEASSGILKTSQTVARIPPPAVFGSTGNSAHTSNLSNATRIALYQLAVQHKTEMVKVSANVNAQFQIQLDEERRRLLEDTSELCKFAVNQAIANNFKPPPPKVYKPGKADWQKSLNKTFRKPILDTIDRLISTHQDWFGFPSITERHEFCKDLELLLLMEAVNNEMYADQSTLCSRLLTLIKAKNMVKPEVYKSFYVEEDSDYELLEGQPEKDHSGEEMYVEDATVPDSVVDSAFDEVVDRYLDYIYTSVQIAGGTAIEQVHLTEEKVLRVYPRQQFAVKFMGLKASGISSCVNGNAPNYAGFRWRYYKGSHSCFINYKDQGWLSWQELRKMVILRHKPPEDLMLTKRKLMSEYSKALDSKPTKLVMG